MSDTDKQPFLESATLKLILGFIVGAAMGGLPSMAFSPLTPFFAAEFALTEAQIGLVATAMGAGSLVCSLPAGKLVDERGSRGILLAVTAVTVGLLMAMSLTNELLLLLAVYFVAGSLRPFSAVASTKATMTSVPVNRRATSVGLVHAGPSLSSAIVSALIPVLAVMLGWRLGIRVVAVALLPAGWWLYRTLPKGPSLRRPDRDSRAILVSVLTGPGFRHSLIVWVSYMGALFVFLTFFVLYLTQELGFDPTTAGFLMAVVQTAAIVGRPLWGVASDRFLEGSMHRAALLMSIASTAVLVILALLPDSTHPAVVAVVALVAGASLMSSRPVGTTLAVQLLSDEDTARALSILSLVTWVAAMLFPPLFGLIVTTTGSWRLAWMLAASVVGVSVPVLLFLRPDESVAGKHP